MSPKDSGEPLLGRADIASPPAAASGLSVADTNSGLTLSKKKSWFGGLGNAVHKVALQAMAAVDLFRIDPQNKSESEGQTRDISDDKPDPRQSNDTDALSTTAIKSDDERSHSATPKSARASLRQHLLHHPSKRHHRQSSMFSTVSRRSGEALDTAGFEKLESPPLPEDSPNISKPKSSMASSMVSSIRGLSIMRRVPHDRALEKLTSLEDKAANIPLPSSPINIPSAAPALKLDLGPTGLMPANFNRSPEAKRTKETLELTDPANITTARPTSHFLPIGSATSSPQAGSYTSSGSDLRPFTPREILHLKLTPLDGGDIKPAPGPPTPMPGTNMPLELDGTSEEPPSKAHTANSIDSDRCQMFERSVTPIDEPKRKELRPMASLDAMAEACTLACTEDDTRADSESSLVTQDGKPDSSKLIAPPPSRVMTPRRNATCDASLPACPSDMEELSRQPANQPNATNVLPGDEWMGDDDPFAPRTSGDGVGPPSPDRRVLLPFRPKDPSPEKDQSIASMVECSPQEDALGDMKPEAQLESESPAEETLAAQLQLDDSVVLQLVQALELEGAAELTEEVVADDGGVGEHDALPKAPLHPVGFTFFPSTESEEAPQEEGLSPHGGPLSPQWLDSEMPTSDLNPSANITETADITNINTAEHKFSLTNWMNDIPSECPPPDQPHTPSRRQQMDASVDSFPSVDAERDTPPISPRSSDTAGRTPSMGERIDFDLARSERNGRYNALFHEVSVDGAVDGEEVWIGLDPQDEDRDVLEAVDPEEDDISRSKPSPRKDSKVCPDWLRASSPLLPKSVETNDVSRSPESCDEHSIACEQHDNGAPSWLKNDVVSTTPTKTPEILPSTPTERPSKSPGPPQASTSSAAISTRLTVMDPLGGHPAINLAGHTPETTHSSTDSPIISSHHPTGTIGHRVTSADTLDDTLDLLQSSQCGYEGDESSAVTSPSPKKKGTPARYRSVGKRAGAGRGYGF
ncbi:hypothetical protein BDY17DRAFT_19186 [Neohortaea acidophila]|uniref:Uncharacterized protein n=1 Tax=Neohortaea acidophila TaxID=245834 RepID=A0A6A6Q5V6_9PEZI|nr:uncharacterized protein BDY17DRAFT_19186 [Neohortaea acidophila]KAF2487828.1 hypothetical protein BDY17DRAFT_19186 [Neohortaea acidophila]